METQRQCGGAARALGSHRGASVVEEAQGGVCQGDALLVAGLDHHVVGSGAPGGRDERHAALQRRKEEEEDTL